MAAWEDYMQQKVGAPIQRAVGQASNATEEQINLAKQMALRKLSGDPQLQMPDQPLPTPQAPGEVNPNAPTMSPTDVKNRTNAMIAAPQTMDQVAAKLRAQANQDAADEAHANMIGDQEMTGYTDVPKPARFQQLKDSMNDEDEEPKARSINNKAGSAEGSYSGS